MNKPALATVIATASLTLAFAAPADKSTGSATQGYLKNIARQHYTSTLSLYDAKGQRYVATEAAAAWLDDDVAIALLDDRVVGCVTFVGPASHHFEFDDHEAASFRFFGVDPAVQGAGVGEAMVDWCVTRARQQGWARLRIHTLDSMPAAQRLYRRKGFVHDPANDQDWDGIVGIAYVMHL